MDGNFCGECLALVAERDVPMDWMHLCTIIEILLFIIESKIPQNFFSYVLFNLLN